MKKLFLVDAYALIFRSYYAFMGRPMRNNDGLNTSAIFGFTKFMMEMIRREQPHYLGVAFDPKGGNFRHDLYPQYKANRDATPEDIIASVPYIKSILEAMRIPVLEVPGYEADDLIGTLSLKASQNGFEVFMVTPDKDFGQLIRPTVHIYKQRKGGEGIEIVDYDKVKEHYGISDPLQVIDILALWGDASDNIPGVPGIGEKGAIKLISEYGSVEGVIANSAKLSPKQRENIETLKDQIMLAKQLATIELNVPVEFDPETLVMEEPDIEKLSEIYKNLGFRYFLQDLNSNNYSVFAQSSQQQPRDLQSQQSQSGGDSPSGSQSSQSQRPWSSSLRQQQSGDSQTPYNAGSEKPHSRTSKGAPQVAAGAVQGDLFAVTESVDPLESDVQNTAQQVDTVSVVAEMYDNIENTPHEYITVDTPEKLSELVAELSSVSEFCFDTETSGLDPFTDKLVGISIAIREHHAWYIPCNVLKERDVVAALKPFFENDAIAKVGQNIKFDMLVLQNAGVEVRGFLYDTMIIHYLLNPESRHGMDYLSREYLNYSPVPIETLIGKGARQITMDMVSVERVAQYAAEDADVTLRLKNLLWAQLQQNELEGLYRDIEEPLIRVLADIERTGVKIDVGNLNASGIELRNELQQIEQQIRDVVGDPSLNVNSPKQLGEALFERLKIDPNPKKTKTKQYKTDEESLTMLSDRHEVVGMILEYRGLKKLLSTYVEALPLLINHKTGRIHTSFNQAVTSTGRLSSTNPNLQNIPIRDDRGREIRRAFIASDNDHVILSVDYSQVELRLMAHLSEDPAMIEAFEQGEDIHAATAARLFGVPISEVTREQRRRAKTANFGIIYGISAFGLAQRLAIPRSEAKEIIDGYFASYPGVKSYMDNIIAQAHMEGYVTTLFGRKRFLPDIRSANANVRSLAERNAINAPIQGGAADIMKIAMIAVHNALMDSGLKSKIILQVHDELLLDVAREELDQVRKLVVDCMENAVKLRVKLIADSGVGENWLEAH